MLLPVPLVAARARRALAAEQNARFDACRGAKHACDEEVSRFDVTASDITAASARPATDDDVSDSEAEDLKPYAKRRKIEVAAAQQFEPAKP